MFKLLLILLIGLGFEATGVVQLKKGMTQLGDLPQMSVPALWSVVKAGATNGHILMGVFFEALFFGCLLILMSKSDISFLWPLTALSFVFTTIAAMVFLNEEVSLIRWVGVILIVGGAACISYSEHAKPKITDASAPSSAKVNAP